MFADLAVAKVGKYATRESGDTVEVVERPHGGLTLVMADGQRSGKSAKAISNIATRKALSLVGEGARDGVVARATHDYLFAMRGGKVRADLQLLSLDLESRTLVISRNTDCYALLIRERRLERLDRVAQPIGIYRNTRPVIDEVPLEPGLGALIFTDGIRHAGARSDRTFEVDTLLEPLFRDGLPGAAVLADAVLQRAIEADQGFPKDDLSVAALLLHAQAPEKIRRMTISFPIDG